MSLYQEDFQTSIKIAKEVLSEVKQRNIPPNPVHYTIWYEYLLKEDPVVAERMLAGENYQAMSLDLYRHIVNRLCLLGDLDCSVLRLVNELIEDILSWEGDLSAKNEQLEAALSELLGNEQNANASSKVVRNVIDVVRSLASDTNQMKGKVEHMRQEVDNLRRQLELTHQEAHTDALTGVGNRRAMDRFLTEVVSKTEADSCILSCIMLDIDYFKRINDDYGHLIGDSVLRFIARMLQDLSKGQDFVARFGGEEFILILPETNLSSAYQFAEKLRQKIEKTQFKLRDTEKKLKFTVSMGVAVHKVGDPIENFIERADNALYIAKGTGRNRVVDEIEAQSSLHH